MTYIQEIFKRMRKSTPDRPEDTAKTEAKIEKIKYLRSIHDCLMILPANDVKYLQALALRINYEHGEGRMLSNGKKFKKKKKLF